MSDAAKKNDFPEMMSLNAGDLIEWMKKRKAEMGLSNAKLAEMSGVPVGTIDRILSRNYTEFRYSSIQPLMAVLIGTQESIPEPDPKDKAQNEFYYNTIEGYKLALENKNHELEELKRLYDRLRDELEAVKAYNAEKQAILFRMAEHEKWMEQMIDDLRK